MKNNHNVLNQNDYIKYHLDNENPRLHYNGKIQRFLPHKLFYKASLYIYLDENDNQIEHTQLTWYSDGKVHFNEVGKLLQPVIEEYVNQTGKSYYTDSYVILRVSKTPFKR